MAILTYLGSANAATVLGGSFFDHRTMRPRAYIDFESPAHAPALMASSANEMLAAAKTSKGAPSSICLARRPVDPKLKITFCPVCFSYAAPTSLNASARSAAAATFKGDDSGAASLRAQ